MDELDKIDRMLLRFLQEDGRRTTLDLARRVGSGTRSMLTIPEDVTPTTTTAATHE